MTKADLQVLILEQVIRYRQVALFPSGLSKQFFIRGIHIFNIGIAGIFAWGSQHITSLITPLTLSLCSHRKKFSKTPHAPPMPFDLGCGSGTVVDSQLRKI